MRGFPKTLSSKEDYYNIKKDFPVEQWRPEWQALLETVNAWYPVKEVKSVEAGVTDATHQVCEMEDSTSSEVKRYFQYELKENPDCKLFRLGFTVTEVKKELEK